MDVPLERPDSTAFAWLEELGYRLAFRRDAWTEVLVRFEDERWIGRGDDDAEAVEDALLAMFPSHAARSLLEGRRSRPELRAVVVEAPPAAAAKPPEAPSAADLARALAAASGGATPDPALLAADPVLEQAAAEEEDTGAFIAPELPEIIVPAAVVATPAVTRPPPASSPPLRPDEALSEVNLIDDVIDSSRQELALMTAERQRLAILAWICHARSLQAASGGHPVVVDAVTNIARKLTAICKFWWPGSVTALQLEATPRDVGRELGLPLSRRPRVWSEAADAAEHRLRFVEQRDEDHRRDEYGWADGPFLEPGPVNPEAHLAELVHLVESLGGPLNKAPSGKLASQYRQPDTDDRRKYSRWIQRARWLRGFVTDFEVWGNLMGRLRWLAQQLDGRYEDVDQGLAAEFRPSRPWAQELGQDPDAKRKKQLKKSVLQSRPWIGDRPGAEAVVSWLVDAFKVLEAERIAQLVAPMREVVVELGPDDIPGANRNKRRRLRQVQKYLSTLDGDGNVVASELDDMDDLDGPDDAAEADVEDAPEPEQVVDPKIALFEAVRQKTAGLRALFVSNRTDPDLEAKLMATFQFGELDWSEGSTRRLQTLAERVSGGSYDLVLGATGFQSHSMDTHLIKACKRAGTPYVRVHRGRALACALALSRELGIKTGC
jgi:hypothetical protein